METVMDDGYAEIRFMRRNAIILYIYKTYVKFQINKCPNIVKVDFFIS